MTALSIIVDIVLILISILLIVVVLMQEGQRQGLGAIGGGAETFFGKNKAQSMEGKLQRITRIAVTAFVVLAIVATILTSHINNNPVTTAAPAVVEEAAEAATETAAEAADAATETAAEAAEAVEETAAEAADAVADTAEQAATEAEAAVEEAAGNNG